MTKPSRHCAWCGGEIPDSGAPGRPRLYCRRSHRQRAFEARRLGGMRGLAVGEAVVRAADLAAMADNLYILRAALDDTADDLRGEPSPARVAAAYEHLRSAATEVTGRTIEPSALGAETDP